MKVFIVVELPERDERYGGIMSVHNTEEGAARALAGLRAKFPKAGPYSTDPQYDVESYDVQEDVPTS